MKGFELDPEKKLWVPGRRKFLFMMGLAGAAVLTGAAPALGEIPRQVTGFMGTVNLEGEILLFDPWVSGKVAMAADPRYEEFIIRRMGWSGCGGKGSTVEVVEPTVFTALDNG